MQLAQVLDGLGYSRSPNFLRCGEEPFEAALDYGHVFRRAAGEQCRLRGTYVLREDPRRPRSPIVPLVYVCEADGEAEANEIHRYVWNQDVVPFLFVNTPECVRLYSGFRYRESPQDAQRGILRALADFNEASEVVEGFHADAIDSGRVWRQWGHAVTPEDRVDWRLLRSLKQLDQWLRDVGGLERRVSHALIGKYVYLHYLRERDILSPQKLGGWGIAPEDVFGRNATLVGFREVVRRLEEWLNGRIFPLPSSGAANAPRREQLRRVAGTFAGDEVTEDGTWQLHLDFQAYDFSYIPIETLSVVYEQFLHTPEEPGGKSKARETGAYYTPIPLVNFMLSELESRRPWQKGTRVFDPACGSGAFLVQCYRRMIETEFPASAVAQPRPTELRELLTRHVFGVDVDSDACSVTELSLILTLLDYVDPPDLENLPQFKLPELRGQNIFCANFFDEGGPWREKLERRKAGWVVGNPPWKKLNPAKLSKDDKPAWDWMTAKPNKSERPVGDNQIAQAFAWEVARYVEGDGEVGLLLPAMTLFENPSRRFRAKFFQEMNVRCVANFSNLAEVLFAGRSRVPAATFFYHPREGRGASPAESRWIRTYSPLVANQEPTRPVVEKKRGETWSLIVNASEVRDVALAHVADGNGLPWKLAAWGSHLDRRLLEKLGRRFPSLGKLEKDGVLVLSEGLQLRREGEGDVEYVEEVVGKNRLNVGPLKKLRKFFVFPLEAIEPNPPELCWARKGRVELPLSVCRPPHVIVSAARHFSVYTDDYLIVPARQIGIASPSEDRRLLKAVSVYLSSDFAFYHQFLTSTQFGVKREVATLGALRSIPVPRFGSPDVDFGPWERLHSRLVEVSLEEFGAAEHADRPLFAAPRSSPRRRELTDELNGLVYDLLDLNRREQALVHDLVNVRLELRDGMLGEPATQQPKGPQIRSYARRLKRELDAFVGEELPKRHAVAVLYDRLSGMVAVDLTRDVAAARAITVVEAGQEGAKELEKTRRRLRKQRAQWVYFDRNLRIYEGTRTFILKPMQRFHWTESQAMFDAAEIIAETLAGPGEGNA